MTREAERFAARQQDALRQAWARRERAREFASALALKFGAADASLLAVIGFGSTFEPERSYRLDSDIDLALSGGDWGKLWSMIPKSEFDVSLVELDPQPDAFARHVRSKGVVLYEKR
jgi:hypothetical protein